MNSKKLRIIRNLQLKGYLRSSLIYLILYVVIMVALTMDIASRIGLGDVSFQVDTFAIITKIFLFIIGIVNFTVTFNDFITQGASRREYFVGTLSAIACLAIFFTILLTAIYLIVGFLNGQAIDVEDTLLLILVSVLLYYAYFIIGWFMGMCFVKYRVIGGIISVIVSAASIALMEISTSVGFVSLVGEMDLTTPMSIPLIYNLLSTIIISFLITYFVYAKTKKIYFKI